MINNIKIIKAADASGANTTEIESAIIDTTGFDGIIFLTTIATANAGNFLKVKDGAGAALEDAADLAGTKTTAVTNGDTLTLDIKRPAKRYLQATITRGASTAAGEIWALLYKKNHVPINNGQRAPRAGYIGKQVISPINGLI